MSLMCRIKYIGFNFTLNMVVTMTMVSNISSMKITPVRTVWKMTMVMRHIVTMMMMMMRFSFPSLLLVIIMMRMRIWMMCVMLMTVIVTHYRYQQTDSSYHLKHFVSKSDCLAWLLSGMLKSYPLVH